MRIGFFGTPDFAIPSLKILCEQGYEIAIVVTVPDKEQGRGLKPSFSAVKKFALQKGLRLLQPENLNDDDFIKQLKELNLDIGVVV
ncbi:MAG: methionyl-tRNA formyltransferase, partial [Ignavibacteria bacterium]|nr:methionyl-tRNA formyltransferase [Ignavibacteria bacterium]